MKLRVKSLLSGSTVGMLIVLLSLAGGASRALAARQSTSLGPITYSGDQVLLGMAPDGRFTVTLSGRAIISVAPAAGSATNASLELKADRIQFNVSADQRVVTGNADGRVFMTQRRPVPAGAGFPAGRSDLVVTGGHAVLDYHTAGRAGSASGPQTVDITGTPQVSITHPRLARPGVLNGARTIHVDLASSTFDAQGGDGPLSMTLEPASPPDESPTARSSP